MNLFLRCGNQASKCLYAEDSTVIVVWHTFFKIEVRNFIIIVCSRLSHPTQKVQILKKLHKTAITICSGLSHPTGWTESPSENTSQRFSRAKKPSEDTTLRLFLMNMKGLILAVVPKHYRYFANTATCRKHTDQNMNIFSLSDFSQI